MFKQFFAIISTAILLLTLGILFYPFLNFKESISSEKNPKTEYVINIYNPFKPRVSEIVTLNEDNAYWVIVTDYQRTGLFSFTRLNSIDGKEKPIDLSQVDAKISNKSLEEIKQIAAKQDLSQKEYVVEKSSEEKAYDLELQKPVECQSAIRVQTKYKESDLSFLYLNMPYLELDNNIKNIKFAGEGKYTEAGKYFLVIDINSDKILKYNLYFGSISPAIDENIKLTKVTKVYSDCREEEILLSDKPNV